MEEAYDLLDNLHNRLSSGDIFSAMHDGVGELKDFHFTAPPLVWKEF